MRPLSILLVLTGLVLGQGAPDHGPVIDRLAPRVVRIAGLAAGRLPIAGVLIGDGSLVLTVSGRGAAGRQVEVALPGGGRVPATVLASGRDSPVVALELASSSIDGVRPGSGELAPGSPVLSAGHPFGALRGGGVPSVGLGIVAAVRRDAPGGVARRYLLTTPVNPGDAGGPLVDGEGRLAGLLLRDRDRLTTLATAIPLTAIREAFAEVPEVLAALEPDPADAADAADAAGYGLWPVHDALRAAASRAAESVLGIVIAPQREGERERRRSAVLLDRSGLLVTTAENLGADVEVTAILPGGREVRAERLGEDERLGIALLRVPPDGLPAPLALAEEGASLGAFVAAVGRPGGREWWQGPLVTIGIVGATNRSDRRYGALHTDAAVNLGNAGGALVDLHGRLVGIPTTLGGSTLTGVGANSGIGFAIPVRPVLARIRALARGDSIAYRPGRLGVRLDMKASPGGGVRVTEVEKGEAAEKAGIRPADVLLSANGDPIGGIEDLRRIFRDFSEGDSIRFLLRRGTEELELEAILAGWPDGPPR